ncbi:MAG: hypothetical protein JWO15_2787 [Sphingomonadales bacterium]|nr:hypothetical protein [Sphingomonadales bacterium]
MISDEIRDGAFDKVNMGNMARTKLELAEAIMKEDEVILAALAASDRMQIEVAGKTMGRRNNELRELSNHDDGQTG